MSIEAGMAEVAGTVPVVGRVLASAVVASVGLSVFSSIKRRFLTRERYEAAKRP